MFNFGFQEILIILILLVVFVGPKKLPDMAKKIGKAMREFRRASDGIKDEIDGYTRLEPDTAPQPAVSASEPEKVPDGDIEKSEILSSPGEMNRASAEKKKEVETAGGAYPQTEAGDQPEDEMAQKDEAKEEKKAETKTQEGVS